VDTAYVLALISHRDQWHHHASRWSRQLEAGRVPLLTTEFVLTEVGNALASVIERKFAVETIKTLQASEYVEIIPASRMLFDAGLDLYASRLDKDWGLTDCTSFVVMKERGIGDALTVDRHFQQARFRALLLED
jgi:predicted nucleic acid-binding protein